VHGAPLIGLGVDAFGQSGARAELYRQHGIAASQIAEAAFSALDAMQ
jgi:pyruvate dehydrogenase E1 component